MEFTCSSCRRPIVLHDSLLKANEETLLQLFPVLVTPYGSVESDSQMRIGSTTFSTPTLSSGTNSPQTFHDISPRAITQILHPTQQQQQAAAFSTNDSNSAVVNTIGLSTSSTSARNTTELSEDSFELIHAGDQSNLLGRRKDIGAPVRSLVKLNTASNIPRSMSMNELASVSVDSESLPTHSHIQALTRLFQAVSDSTNIDQPLCMECTQQLFNGFDTRLKEEQRDNQIYRRFLQDAGFNVSLLLPSSNQSSYSASPSSFSTPNSSSLLSIFESKTVPHVTAILSSLQALGGNLLSHEDLEEELAHLETEEKQLRKELEIILHQREICTKKCQMLALEEKKLDILEERYWENCNDFCAEVKAAKEERDGLQTKREYANTQLEKLRKTNVYNDTFHIYYSGHFGTINNFRLGRLEAQQVDWNEINAAWGQAALLLYTLANKLNFKFSTFQILPMGSMSKVARRDDNSTYELYGTSDISLARILWYRSFDKAMVAYLKCLKELLDYVKSIDPTFDFPYQIEKDLIQGESIQCTNDQSWTKALKYMLTNLKFLLSWMAKRGI